MITMLFFYGYYVIRLHQVCTGSILYGSFTPVQFDYIGVLKGVSGIAVTLLGQPKVSFGQHMTGFSFI
jgi:hypothetical protein